MAAIMTNQERDDDTGKFTEKYSHEEFIEAIKKEDGMAGTTDVAERVGVIRETAYKRLCRMEESGYVNSKKVGNSLVWFVNSDK